MSILAYVSGHGLGHSAREAAILRHLPPEIPLTLKTAAPAWFWQGELPRPFTLLAESFDVGCVQRNGIEIDVSGTLAAWQVKERENRGRLDAEVAWVREQGFRLIVSDVPSFAMTVADRAGIPSVCVVNFTWADIYRNLGGTAEEQRELNSIADRLETEYARATVALETGFAVPMPYFPHKKSVGLVARKPLPNPVPARERLLAVLPETAHGKRLALVYVGGWGLPISYQRVAEFTDWHFLSLDAPPDLPPNWTVLPRSLMDHPALVDAMDLVISKPGYGLAAECVSLGTPFLYPPRPQFAEFAPMDAVLRDWAGGIPLTTDEFLQVQWRPFLDHAATLTNIPRLPAEGGAKAIKQIIAIL
ncbi:MAG: hypothetical protein OHK0029_33930 [Armatimonadaceae bacterium]